MECAKLKGAIVGHGRTVKETAESLNISQSAFYRKLHGKTEFRRDEINKIVDFLGLTDEETLGIFFADKVS